jgi:NAD(P)-dependent dehydrogenase (short-subunit alcohol dehydrogenase family)
MVNLSDVQRANDALKSTTSDITAVVVGASNGIGRGFIGQLAAQTAKPKIYFVARRPEVISEIQAELTALNPSGTYIGIEAGDLTLLANVEKATQQILAQEKKKIDLLFISVGFITLSSTRNPTTEDLDKITSIRYYARMRFVVNLLPLLNAAPAPRVVSVLAGGQEGTIFPEDLSLKDPAHYSFINAAVAGATYMTLFFEQLQKQQPKISFVHAFPGFVRTNLFNDSQNLPWAARFLVNWMILPVVGRFVALSPEQSGARMVYAATTSRFAAAAVDGVDAAAVGSNGETQSGVYTLNEKSDTVHNDGALVPLRESGADKKIYEHTMEEFRRILGRE